MLCHLIDYFDRIFITWDGEACVMYVGMKVVNEMKCPQGGGEKMMGDLCDRLIPLSISPAFAKVLSHQINRSSTNLPHLDRSGNLFVQCLD